MEVFLILSDNIFINYKLMKISNLPPKGTRDWDPVEFNKRKYIFDKWRDVCLKFGYKEYLTPLIENSDVYKAKSGEDVGGTELTTFLDRGGREMAIRPEMTPSVTRMVTKFYESSPKPIRLFSIANFFRNENPQRGRNREFWQLNADIFGSNSIYSDIEILQLAIELMLSFNPPKNSFKVRLNNRLLLDGMLDLLQLKDEQTKALLVRLLDKWFKLDEVAIDNKLKELGLDDKGVSLLKTFMSSKDILELKKNVSELSNNKGLIDLKELLKNLEDLGYVDWIEFNPTIIRGFDYYNGMIFEVFDNNPENLRAMFGGGRYNGLSEIFGVNPFPSVGFAPGDETTKLFLESWNLFPSFKSDITYIPILSIEMYKDVLSLAINLRKKGLNVLVGVEEQNISKALSYANKIEAKEVVIFGTQELEKGIYSVKNLETGEQNDINLE